MADEVTDEKSPRLWFTSFSKPEGFGSHSISIGNDVSPAPIVRELIQNSLDAGQLAGRSEVKIRFEFDAVRTAEIPGWEEFKEAFHAAEDAHSEYLEAVEAQYLRFLDCIESPTLPVLHVIDNGIGLNDQRMNAMLGDGTTSKTNDEANSAGSYGLGHFTAFPASNLQYILYGGLTKDGVRCASAHAILASHELNGELKGKDGYFVLETRNDVRNRYVFPKNGQIPSIIDRKLSEIEKQSNSGSVVSITAFNEFMDEDQSAVELILASAAKHFFPAIHRKRLTIEVLKDGKKTILDQAKLHELLQSIKTEKRTRDTINGNKAFSAFQTLCTGNSEEIETDFGKVTISMRQTPNEITRVSLFRNGMYITDYLPRNRPGNFTKFLPFNAIILLDPPSDIDNPRAFELIRKAEGEKHSDIKKQRLAEKHWKNFNELFNSIRQKIGEMAENDNAEFFIPRGFMPIDSHGTSNPSQNQSTRKRKVTEQTGSSVVHPEFLQTSESLLSNILEGDGGNSHENKSNAESGNPGSGDDDGKGERKIPGGQDGMQPNFDPRGTVADIQSMARFSEKNVELLICPNTDLENACVRITTDSGSDPSCTDPIQEKFLSLTTGASLNGQTLPSDAYAYGENDSKIYEVRLGPIYKGERKRLSIPLLDQYSDRTVFKVNVVNRKLQNRN